MPTLRQVHNVCHKHVHIISSSIAVPLRTYVAAFLTLSIRVQKIKFHIQIFCMLLLFKASLLHRMTPYHKVKSFQGLTFHQLFAAKAKLLRNQFSMVRRIFLIKVSFHQFHHCILSTMSPSLLPILVIHASMHRKCRSLFHPLQPNMLLLVSQVPMLQLSTFHFYI